MIDYFSYILRAIKLYGSLRLSLAKPNKLLRLKSIKSYNKMNPVLK